MKLVGHSSGITNGSSRKSKSVTSLRNQKSHHPTGTIDFIAVDGEGITLENNEHRYVLLGIGDDQIEDENGLQWNTILSFLYSHYMPGVAFVGFFLKYDFDNWLATMPEDRVKRLITSEGMAARRGYEFMHGQPLPVDMPYGWQIRVLGNKYFEFRKRDCNCSRYYCEHSKGSWMRICDAGSFFQTSFLRAIDPSQWSTSILSNDEYELIRKGKENRPYATCIDDEMRFYNKLENEILVRLMKVLDSGFREMGILLSPHQWFGPGQAAQKWLSNEGIAKTKDIQKSVPTWILEAAKMSYFGGWFEIMMHGIIPGITHGYDINSAYPYIIANLPCLLHGDYDYGDGDNYKDTGYVLVYAYVSSYEQGKRPPTIGTMLHRNDDSSVMRPLTTIGWYWLHELEAAKRADLIRECDIYKWMSYDPCDCVPPMRNVQFLYDLRLKNDKNSPLGKGCKLAYNSMYGKFAQSIGDPKFANPIWASLITAGCRTMILNAIATHPKGKDDVCMVATDAVYFCTPHPELPISDKLGEWGYKPHNNLTLFKPGVYWDDRTRKDINENRYPVFKARGIRAADFACTIEQIDNKFKEWDTIHPEMSDHDGYVSGWPFVVFEGGFSMVSCLQAIRRNKWETAATVNQHPILQQNANPYGKREGPFKAVLNDGRIVWRSIPWNLKDEWRYSLPYLKRFGMDDPWSDESLEQFGISPDGYVRDIIAEWLGINA